MRSRALKQKRASAIERAKAIATTAETETRDLNEAEVSETAELRSQVEAFDKQISTAEFFEQAAAQGARPIHGDHGWRDLMRRVTLRSAILSMLPNAQQASGVDFGPVREAHAELERRGMRAEDGGILIPTEIFHVERREVTTTTPAAGPGSNLIGEELLAGQYVDLLRSAMQVPKLGATMISGLTGNVAIPGGQKGATASWFDEANDIEESDPEFRQILSSPKFVGAIVSWSINMVLQSSPAMEMLMRRELAETLARAVDFGALYGDGTARTPIGVLNTVGIGATAVAGPLTWAVIVDAIAAVEGRNATLTGWATSPAVMSWGRKTLVAPTAGSTMLIGDQDVIGGRPAAVSTQTPAGLLLGGGFNDLMILSWQALQLLVNPFSSPQFERGGLKLRAIMSMNTAVRHVESFQKLTGLTAPVVTPP